jgi:hypothetical protein
MSAKQLGILLVVLLGAGVAVIIWKGSTPPPEIGHNPPENSISGAPDPEIQKLHAAAIRLQEEKKWCEAKQKWEELQARLPEDSEYREDAERNLKTVARLCEPPVSFVSEIKIPEPPREQRPAEVAEKDLVAFYPVGRTIQSIALLNASGTGTNRQWIFQGASYFAYQYRVALETEVIENRGTAVVFRQHFNDVVQLRATSKATLELDLPETPILDLVWEPLILKPIPNYRGVKKLAEIILIADPRLKRTLTFFQKQLKRAGVSLDDSEEVEMVALLERVAGKRLEVEYISGLGVTYIKVLDGEQMDPNDLERLAYNSGLLMDYFLSKSDGAAPGETFEVRAQDVGGMLSIGYDVKVDGELEFKKLPDAGPNGEAVVEVAGGEVVVDASVDGIDRTGHLKPISGFARYSSEERVVREGRMAWQADTNWITTDHLLFGTEKIRNLKLESYYEASQVKTGQQEAAQ